MDLCPQAARTPRGRVGDSAIDHADGRRESDVGLYPDPRCPEERGHCVARSTVARIRFDVPSFVAEVRALGITSHVAQKVKGSAIDDRTTRHAGYAISQQKQKLIEQVFGWMKTVGGLRKCGIAAGSSLIGS